MKPSEVFKMALRGERPSYTPIWFMRQAGRYLPEYRKIKEKYSFLQMCTNPEIAAKVTLMPLSLGVDALIVFSDIFIPLLSMGADVEYKENVQPKVDIDAWFEYKGLGDLSFLEKTIKIVKEETHDLPLLGFAAAPFTLLCYIFGGREFSNIRAFMFSDPHNFDKLMKKMTKLTIDYLNFQIKSGCDVIQIFDSWAGILREDLYRRLVFPYIREIVDNVRVPVIYFMKDSCHVNHVFKSIGADCFSVDSRVSLSGLYSVTKRCVQGNLDNTILLTDRETIKRETLKVLDQARDIPHIFNLSHGVLPQTSPENIKFLVDFVHNETSK